MNKEFRRMMELAGLAEMKINNPGDLSNPTNLKRVLDKIPNEKYFPIIKDDEENYIPYDDTQWDDIASNIVDDLYDPIFDDYIKGKPGIEEDNYWDWIDNEREKNDDEQGPLERLVIDKIWDILNDYKNQQKNLDEIKVNTPGGNYMQIWPIGELINFFKNDQDVFKGSNIDKIIEKNIQELKKRIWKRYKDVYMEYDEENENVKDYPKNSNDVFNPEKQTGNLYDAAYYESGNLILPYINKFLNDKQWEYMGDDVFKKDDREIEIFDYIYHTDDLYYDTDPRDGLYMDFMDYFEENSR